MTPVHQRSTSNKPIKWNVGCHDCKAFGSGYAPTAGHALGAIDSWKEEHHRTVFGCSKSFTWSSYSRVKETAQSRHKPAPPYPEFGAEDGLTPAEQEKVADWLFGAGKTPYPSVQKYGILPDERPHGGI